MVWKAQTIMLPCWWDVRLEDSGFILDDMEKTYLEDLFKSPIDNLKPSQGYRVVIVPLAHKPFAI